MGGRTHRALIAAAVLAAHAAVAQNPPPAPARDTLTPELIFNDVFTTNAAIPGSVVLSEGVVYRVEIQPNAASVSFRVRRHPTLPPLLMVALSGEAAESQTAYYLIVPRASDEYRIDVTAQGDEPVRVRIWSDPREMSRYARMRAATGGLPTAGLGLRFAYLGPFQTPPRYVGAPAPENTSALGAELCLGVVPRGAWSYGSIGGCVLQIGYYSRPPHGNMLFFSVAPHVEVTAPRAPTQISATAQVGLGTTLSVSQSSGGSVTYLILGLGLDAATPVPETSRHLWLDAELSLVRIQQVKGYTPAGGANIVPRLATGVQFRF